MPTRSRAPSQKSTPYPALTGVRGIAALTVALSHVAIWTSWGPGGVAWIPGQWAVDLFFVLSGTVISMTYLRGAPVSWRRFFTARFARIYPLHLATAALLGALYIRHALRTGTSTAAVGVAHIIREVTLTSAMPIVGDGLMWNDPSWSICVESWVYILIFPVIAWLTPRTPAKPAAVAALALLAIGGFSMMSLPSDTIVKIGWIAYGRAVVEFAAGWCAYRMIGKVEVPTMLTDCLAVALPILLVISRLMPGGRDAWFLMPIFPLFVLGLTNPKSIAARLLSVKPMVFLGEISYSIYLLHAPLKYIISPILLKLGLMVSVPFYLFGFIPLLLLVSASTYYSFERPARDGLRKLLDRSDPAEPAIARAAF